MYLGWEERQGPECSTSFWAISGIFIFCQEYPKNGKLLKRYKQENDKFEFHVFKKDYSGHSKENEFGRSQMEPVNLVTHLLQKSRQMTGAWARMGVAERTKR